MLRRDAGVYPLSPMQHGMLYHYLSAPHPGADVIQFVCELREDVDVERLRTAWHRVASRHQPLRARFRWHGVESPTQEVLAHVELDLEVADWRDRTPAERDQEFSDHVERDRRRGFDLTTAPATRLLLVRWTEAEWRCLWSFPHILMDGRGAHVVLSEVFDLYDNGPQYEPPAAPQYSAFLEWIGARNHTGEESYWRRLLDGITSPTPLPGDAGIGSSNGAGLAQRFVRLTSRETGRLASSAKEAGVTVSAGVHGAWALLLSRYSGADDVVFGAARACRHGTVPNAENIVGLFINTLPVRARYAPDTSVRDWLRELRQQQIDVRAYEHTPPADIQRWMGFGAGQLLFESIIVFDRALTDGLIHAERPAWTHRTFRVYEPAPSPLTLYARDGDELELKLVYDRDRIPD
ncbi:MAG: condensation domain-containing protein, partial [Gemmatimonadota bacterium]|nr:condensation domain-containing protein [Gemmatimonadota bacterium]